MIGLISVLLVGLSRAESLEDILPDPSWASLLESSSRGHLLAIGSGNNTCEAIYSCQDCNTARVCRPTVDGSFEVVQTIPCTTDRPFCDPASGSCVSWEPESCGGPDDFICLGNGKYPDIDCTKFHACLQYQSLTFQCAVPGETYNARTQTCEPKAPCGTFDCTSAQGRKVPHSLYSGYFAYCRQENAALVVDSCPGNYQLNITSQNCEPICQEEGILEDLADCHFYYKCTRIVVNKDLAYLQRERLRCPQGQAYSKKDFLCIDENNVENCTKL